MLEFKLINSQDDFIEHYHYNRELAIENMPTTFPCIIVNFNRYLGYVCGYVKLYTVHYIPLVVIDTNKYFENFINDPCDKPYIDNVIYNKLHLKDIHINNVGSTSFQASKLLEWKTKPRIKKNP